VRAGSAAFVRLQRRTAIYTPDVNNEQSDENLGKPLIDMIQTGNNMQIRRVKDCQAEVSTLESTPNLKSTFKPNMGPSDQNASPIHGC
jgi:hypothetical protein